MHRIVILYSFILLTICGYSQVSTWERCGDCDIGIFYYKQIDTVNFKVSAKVRINAPLSEVLKIVSDVENYNSWVYNSKSVDLIEKESQYSGIYYMLINAPFPLNDIDVIMDYQIESNDSSFTLTQNCIPDYYSVNKKLQRVLRYDAVWKFKRIDKNTTELLYIVKMGGPKNLPEFILKIFLCVGPKSTLSELNEKCSHVVDSQ